MSENDKKYLFDNPKNVSRLLKATYLICAALFIADFIIHRHTLSSWEGIPGFYAIYGFVACVLLVVLAKEMRKLVMRKEDYYDVDK